MHYFDPFLTKIVAQSSSISSGSTIPEKTEDGALCHCILSFFIRRLVPKRALFFLKKASLKATLPAVICWCCSACRDHSLLVCYITSAELDLICSSS